MELRRRVIQCVTVIQDAKKQVGFIEQLLAQSAVSDSLRQLLQAEVANLVDNMGTVRHRQYLSQLQSLDSRPYQLTKLIGGLDERGQMLGWTKTDGRG